MAGNGAKNLQALIFADGQLAFLDELVAQAMNTIQPKRIILFGSRATGHARRTSDGDLYFDLAGANVNEWPRFCIEEEETLPTLLEIDFVDSRSASPKIVEPVNRHGIIIYERSH
jgi:predicted nucleotidyltransferase